MADLQYMELSKDDDRERRWGTTLVVISAMGFGLMAIFAKFAYAAHLNMLTILSVRFTITSLLLWLIVLIKGENYKLDRKKIFVLLILGAMGYALMSTCFFKAVKLIPASVASILLYTYPIIVTILSVWLFQERINKYKISALILSFIGLILVVGVVYVGLNLTGVIFGLMAAVVYSLYIVISNKYVKSINPIIFTLYITTSAAIIFNLVGWTTGNVTLNISLQGWLSIFGIAIFSSIIAILTFFQGMKIIGPSRASIISTLEPVVTISAAFILFGEKMTILQIIGGILILGAVILIQKDK